MIRLNRSVLRVAAAAVALTLVSVACGDDDDDAAAEDTGGSASGKTIPVGHDTGAAKARAGLTGLLQEHVYLAGAATNAALGGRAAEFEAAAAGLDKNSVALSELIGSVFGAEAEEAFLPLWRKHIEFVVQYTQGKAAGDVAKQDKAVSDLLGYTQDFGAFINSALPKLDVKSVADMVATHVETLKGTIDAQADKDWPAAYTALRTAAGHMNLMGETLSAEIAVLKQKEVPGDAKSPASIVRTQLDSQLREHVFLAAAATDAAVGGRGDEFQAAAAALDGNSDALIATIASVYGDTPTKEKEVAAAFGPLWKSHITMIADYATGLGEGNGGRAAKAVSDLTAYAQTFGVALNQLSPDLPADTVAGLVATHVATLKAVIDAQSGNQWPAAYDNLREAAAHMDKIAEPLTGVIVKQFSDLFPGAA